MRLKDGFRLLAALAVALGLSGCIGDQAAFVHSVWRPADARPVTATVYYVTDRAPDKDWPGGFGKHWSDGAWCGTTVATIPPANLPGEPVPTGSIGAGAPLACGAAMEGIADAIAAAARQKNCRSVLLYIHGFNTLFDGAMLRAGQLALDTQSGCVVAAFSWSSEGEVGRYVADIEHSAYAVPVLEAFLNALAAAHLRVDIVGHSMGNRVALQALASLAHRAEPPRAFVGELILAAADIGADPQNDDFAHLLQDALPFARRVTIYASGGDAVLAVSAVAHGDVPRAGRRPLSDADLEAHGADRPVIDVVDATEAPAELLGHSYFGLSYEAVSDIALTLRGVPIRERLAPPATLACRTPDGPACDPQKPHYVLNVARDRRPDWLVRLTRRLVPLIPRVELAPLASGPQ